MLRLPLWFVSERGQRTTSTAARCDDPGAMIAFSTTEKLTSFLAGSGASEWKVNLAGDREGLVIVIAIAHNQGIESICIDPAADGSGGKHVSLKELLALANSLK